MTIETAELVSRLNASRDSLKQLNIGEYTLIRSARDVMADAANALDAYDKTMQRIAEEPSALTHRQAAALIRSAPAPGREEIARIIDPSAWTTLDMLYAELVQRGGKPNPARFKDGWSLDKADAILALFHAPAEAGGGEDEKKLCPECQGTGLQRIEGLYDDCPKCDGDGLVSPSPTPPAGDGWRMVPVEPTEAMRDAAWADATNEDAAGVWRSMIAAAPPPPVSKEPG